MTKHFAAGVVLGVVGTIVLAIAIWLGMIYTGAYNVAASDPHADVVRWTLDTTMHRSVAGRAASVDLPADPSDAVIAKGANHYAENCVHCHGAPGQNPAHWSKGMRPEPPDLTEAAAEWTLEEIHWIVANGIKMSGMPAMSSHHSSQDIVALAVFVEALPGLSPEDYQALTRTASGRATHESVTTETDE